VGAVGVTVRGERDSALAAGALTAPDGTFRIQGLRPGRYAVRWINGRDTRDVRSGGEATSGEKLQAPDRGDWLLRLTAADATSR
jgi:hypothetical protein